jgi:hypothetical protein
MKLLRFGYFPTCRGAVHGFKTHHLNTQNTVQLCTQPTPPISNLIITFSADDDVALAGHRGKPIPRIAKKRHTMQNDPMSAALQFDSFFQFLAAGARPLPLAMTIHVAHFGVLTSVKPWPDGNMKVRT